MASRVTEAGGELQTLKDFESPELENRRDILVWLPPSYHLDERAYPVLYMQDGQNLFDPATSYAGDWKLLRLLASAARRGVEVIVVGIPNMGAERLAEYSPFVDPAQGGGAGDRYLDFLTRTLKPVIDERFRTLPGRAHTGIAGSSMGGLISLYGFFRSPAVFGFTGVLSPSLWFAGDAIFSAVERAPFRPGRIYLDIGTTEGPAHVVRARRMRDLLTHKGYRVGDNLRWLESRCGRHDETSWARRFARALPFLLAREDRR
jgi:predicted alpha/beta superfamily hydrolase